MTGTSRPALAIGVVGHQFRRLPVRDTPPWQDLVLAIDLMLRRLGEAVLTAVRETAGNSHAIPEIAVITCLASGADQLVAHAAVRRAAAQPRFRLHSILPFEIGRYGAGMGERDRAGLQQLAASSDVLDTLEVCGDDEASYRAASELLRARADLLLAIWDGGPSGGPGSTAESVMAALDREMPVIWLRPLAPQPQLLSHRHALDEPDAFGEPQPVAPLQLERLVADLLRRERARGLAGSGLTG